MRIADADELTLTVVLGVVRVAENVVHDETGHVGAQRVGGQVDQRGEGGGGAKWSRAVQQQQVTQQLKRLRTTRPRLLLEITRANFHIILGDDMKNLILKTKCFYSHSFLYIVHITFNRQPHSMAIKSFKVLAFVVAMTDTWYIVDQGVIYFCSSLMWSHLDPTRA